MQYLAILGRQPELSLAELEALGFLVQKTVRRPEANVAVVEGPEVEKAKARDRVVNFARIGGTIKLGVRLEQQPLEFLMGLPEGKITLGVSDYSKGADTRAVRQLGLKWKRILERKGRKIRVLENKNAILSSATSLHGGVGGQNSRKVELMHFDKVWYRLTGVQDIDAYAKRDQKRPARDAKIGMLPPKLAQMMLNLASGVGPRSRILDPFCGTGVVLQEAILMGFAAYGTDKDSRMVEFARKNLEWLVDGGSRQGFLGAHPLFEVEEGDATSFQWRGRLDAVVTEGYLGKPFTRVPTEVEMKEEKAVCEALVRRFLQNLYPQIAAGTPVVMAWPAWLRASGEYQRLNMLDEIEKLGYNVMDKMREGLLYHRGGQIVARDIIISRKK